MSDPVLERKRKLYEEWKAKQQGNEADSPEPVVTEKPVPPLPPLPELPPELEEQRRRNREKHPDIAAFYDECRRYFGNDVEIISLEER